ncbi:MAG: EF-hand domain-containing protein [Pseudomonadota bacterium]
MKRHNALLTAAVAVAGLAVVVSGALADQLMAQDEPLAPPFAFERPGPEGPRMGHLGTHQGPLTRDQAVESALERFDRHDTDGNGEVSAEEVSARIQERANNRVIRGFDRRDANDDGVITSAEVQAQVGDHFDLIDTNDDGVITEEERRQLHEALMAVSGHHKR